MIASKLQSSAAKWNAKHRSSGIRGTSKWKQSLKAHFVHFTKFVSHYSRLEKGKWKQDLSNAAALTINEICPRWQNNSAHSATRDLILTVTKKEVSPRKTWLEEKAYAWLKWILTCSEGSKIQIEQVSMQPAHAISVAFHIFLGNPYNLETFVKYLRGRRNETIKKLIRAHDGHYKNSRILDEAIGREVFSLVNVHGVI